VAVGDGVGGVDVFIVSPTNKSAKISARHLFSFLLFVFFLFSVPQ
jgi:hypothetical protein